MMHTLRIIILVILFFILYKLLFGGRKKKKVAGPSSKKQQSVAQDILVEDPVCHSYVPKKEAVKAIKDGETHYFCSEKCCQTFLDEQGEKK